MVQIALESQVVTSLRKKWSRSVFFSAEPGSRGRMRFERQRGGGTPQDWQC